MKQQGIKIIIIIGRTIWTSSHSTSVYDRRTYTTRGGWENAIKQKLQDMVQLRVEYSIQIRTQVNNVHNISIWTQIWIWTMWKRTSLMFVKQHNTNISDSKLCNTRQQLTLVLV